MKLAHFTSVRRFFLCTLVCHIFYGGLLAQDQNGDPRLYSFKSEPETELSEKDTTTQKWDARLLNHYSPEELNNLKQTSPDKYAFIESYYTRSYYFLYSSDTANLTKTFLDPSQFDVSKYETRRQENETETIHFSKYGVTLVLLPKKQLNAIKMKE